MTRREADEAVHAEPASRNGATSTIPLALPTTCQAMAAGRYIAEAVTIHDANGAAMNVTVVLVISGAMRVVEEARSVVDKLHRSLRSLPVNANGQLELGRLTDAPKLKLFSAEHRGISEARNTEQRYTECN